MGPGIKPESHNRDDQHQPEKPDNSRPAFLPDRRIHQPDDQEPDHHLQANQSRIAEKPMNAVKAILRQPLMIDPAMAGLRERKGIDPMKPFCPGRRLNKEDIPPKINISLVRGKDLDAKRGNGGNR